MVRQVSWRVLVLDIACFTTNFIWLSSKLIIWVKFCLHHYFKCYFKFTLDFELDSTNLGTPYIIDISNSNIFIPTYYFLKFTLNITYYVNFFL